MDDPADHPTIINSRAVPVQAESDSDFQIRCHLIQYPYWIEGQQGWDDLFPTIFVGGVRQWS
jgi:hypothetical protein